MYSLRVMNDKGSTCCFYHVELKGNTGIGGGDVACPEKKKRERKQSLLTNSHNDIVSLLVHVALS